MNFFHKARFVMKESEWIHVGVNLDETKLKLTDDTWDRSKTKYILLTQTLLAVVLLANFIQLTNIRFSFFPVPKGNSRKLKQVEKNGKVADAGFKSANAAYG